MLRLFLWTTVRDTLFLMPISWYSFLWAINSSNPRHPWYTIICPFLYQTHLKHSLDLKFQGLYWVMESLITYNNYIRKLSKWMTPGLTSHYNFVWYDGLFQSGNAMSVLSRKTHHIWNFSSCFLGKLLKSLDQLEQ